MKLSKRNTKDSSPSLFSILNQSITRLKANGKLRTAETYTAALRSFKAFNSDIDIPLSQLSAETIERYQAWHLKRGNTLNTVSFYMRILRAAYNRAVEAGTISDRRPFSHVYTGVDKTIKRALPLSAIRKIRDLDLTSSPTAAHARDIFMLSFYLRGMSFIDMAYLRKGDLRKGHITYRRRKTGQPLSIAWTSEMQAILDKYPPNPTCYLLPIIRTVGVNERWAYLNAGYNINHHLKKIGTRLNLPLTLTLYVARHSWATAAQTKGIPISTISEGLGHDREATTRIYLASLSTTAVDRANAIILRSL